MGWEIKSREWVERHKERMYLRGVLATADRLELLLSSLEKAWTGTSEEKGFPPVLIGRVREPSGLFSGFDVGQWCVVVFENKSKECLEGPFVDLESALDFAVRELCVESLSRLETADSYMGREGLDDEDAPDELLERFATTPYDAGDEREAHWLELDEDARLSAIRLYHRRCGQPHPHGGDSWGHAVVHVFAEAAFLMNREPVCREAFDAWRRAGLSRHEALHALGDCIGERFRAEAAGHTRGDLAARLAAVDLDRYRGTAPD